MYQDGLLATLQPVIIISVWHNLCLFINLYGNGVMVGTSVGHQKVGLKVVFPPHNMLSVFFLQGSLQIVTLLPTSSVHNTSDLNTITDFYYARYNLIKFHLLLV